MKDLISQFMKRNKFAASLIRRQPICWVLQELRHYEVKIPPEAVSDKDGSWLRKLLFYLGFKFNSGYIKKNKYNPAETEKEVDDYMCNVYEDDPDVKSYNLEDYEDRRKEKERRRMLQAQVRKRNKVSLEQEHSGNDLQSKSKFNVSKN